MLKVLGVSLQNLGTELETNLGLCSHSSLGIHWALLLGAIVLIGMKYEL